jgi:hypothetical protein
MADVQIAVIDTTENQVNVAVPGVQGPIGLTGSVAIAQAGTATEPGIRFESDTNTGIYSPGADQLAVSTGGTERMRLDSSGLLGLGTSSPQSLLHVEQANVNQNLIASAGNAVFRMADSATSGTRKEFTITLDNTNNRVDIQAVQQGVATRNITLNSQGGNVGIGIASPSSLLHLADAGDITVGTTTGTKIGTATTQKIGFYNATPVVQPTAVVDATDAATVITQLNDLLAKLRTLGIIAT